MHRQSTVLIAAAILGASAAFGVAEDDPREQALVTMRKAATYFRSDVAHRGGYVYYYSPDLKRRLGEGVASPDQIWVQPPGTPAVGMAYLRAYEVTGERRYLESARVAAEAIVYGQLKSGGWTNSIDFDRGSRNVALYRNGMGKGKNNSTLDDGISQAAIRLLMHVDRAEKFGNQKVHESAEVALDALLKAQFRNGGFPQVWKGPVTPQPIVKASYPKHDWKTEGRVKNYWDMYTLNDGVAGTVSRTLLDAYQIYGEERYKDALIRFGDFLLLAQMPKPQPAWAQQYNYQMQPIWARRFEPAAIAGRESQDVVETLLRIREFTKSTKYDGSIRLALNYLKASEIKDGVLARYYELETNQPLYMKRKGKNYTLTYESRLAPSHYGWQASSRVDSLRRQFQVGVAIEPSSTNNLRQVVRTVIDSLDEQGRWVSTYVDQTLVGQPKFRRGEKYLSSAVFARNMELLCDYLLASKK